MKSRDRRALVVGAVIIALALGAFRVLPWAMRKGTAAHDELALESASLARMQRDIADAPAIEATAVTLRGQLAELSPRIVDGGTPAESAATLTAHVAHLATEHDVRIERSDLLPDSTRVGRLSKVALQLAFEGDTRGVALFVRGLEVGTLALIVTDLRISALDAVSAPTAPEVLRAELIVRGWFLAASNT